MTGNTTDITRVSANPASVGATVRRSTPKNRTSAGTQPSSGSNRDAEVAEELSVSGSGILPKPPTRCGKRLNGVGVESNDGEETRHEHWRHPRLWRGDPRRCRR